MVERGTRVEGERRRVSGYMSAVLYKASGDSDEEENIGPRAVLAADGEPTDDGSPPCDGLEYLRRVRKEASAIPDVVTVGDAAARAQHCPAQHRPT